MCVPNFWCDAKNVWKKWKFCTNLFVHTVISYKNCTSKLCDHIFLASDNKVTKNIS